MLQLTSVNTGRNVSMLLVERLRGNTLIGLLKGDENNTFNFTLCPDFHNLAKEFIKKVVEWDYYLGRVDLEKQSPPDDIRKLDETLDRIEELSVVSWEALPAFVREELDKSDSHTILLSYDDFYSYFPFEMLQYRSGACLGDVCLARKSLCTY